jgi:putative ABC transport system substrate-binding protein
MEQMSRSAAELLAWLPDVIFAPSNLAVDAINPVAGSIPIVFVAGDPVGSGFVASLAHPGGTVYGAELTDIVRRAAGYVDRMRRRGD